MGFLPLHLGQYRLKCAATPKIIRTGNKEEITALTVSMSIIVQKYTLRDAKSQENCDW